MTLVIRQIVQPASRRCGVAARGRATCVSAVRVRPNGYQPTRPITTGVTYTVYRLPAALNVTCSRQFFRATSEKAAFADSVVADVTSCVVNGNTYIQLCSTIILEHIEKSCTPQPAVLRVSRSSCPTGSHQKRNSNNFGGHLHVCLRSALQAISSCRCHGGLVRFQLFMERHVVSLEV